jgi:hypothetical protein
MPATNHKKYMKTINFHIKTDSYAWQIIDVLHAYYQSLGTEFKTNTEFRMSSNFDPSADTNVFCDYMPDTIDYEELKKYQLILLTGSCEPLVVGTAAMVECLHKLDNCYVVANSLLTQDHNLYHKVIWFPANIFECRQLWTSQLYPHSFENINNLQKTKKQSMIFINGQKRAHRHHFIQLLKNRNIVMPIRSSLGTNVVETNDVVMHESSDDTKFREWVNNHYSDIIPRNQFADSDYYDNLTDIGINGKFGTPPRGYRILQEYFAYNCVVFPESTWQNDELAITEKALKCFFAGSLPWPVGGSKLKSLYNQIGFFTAWNLLPSELQKFDSIPDHHERYQQEVLAIEWLSNNPDVFDLDSTKQMIASNRDLLYNNNIITLEFTKQFDQIIKKHLT